MSERRGALAWRINRRGLAPHARPPRRCAASNAAGYRNGVALCLLSVHELIQQDCAEYSYLPHNADAYYSSMNISMFFS